MNRGQIWAVWMVVAAALVVVPASGARTQASNNPSVSLTAPAAGSTLRGTVTLAAKATPGRYSISRVDYYVDSRLVGSDSSSPYTVQWNSSSVSDGAHRLTAVAYDSHKGSAQSPPQTNTIHNAPPTTAITDSPPTPTFETSASFEFTSDTADATFQCSIDLGPQAPCTSPASYTDLAVGKHTFRVAAVDQYGAVDPSPASATWEIQAAQSLVANGNFEGTTQGWGSGTATLSVVHDGVVGGTGAAKVVWKGTGTSYAMTSAWGKWPVTSATLGHTYVTDAWLRSDTPGKTVCVTIREWADNFATWVGTSSSCVVTTTSWQQVPTLYFSQTSAGDGLDLSINQKDAPAAGDGFEVDGVALHELAPATQTQPADPVILSAGDVAGCWVNSDEQTAAIVQSMPWATVQLLGDNAYPDGGVEPYKCYDKTWGRFKDRTHPAVGNHDYDTPGASEYYGYFGAAAGNPSQGYYSYDLGTWHVIVLNSNCTKLSGGCFQGSQEERWLQSDLRSHQQKCTLAVYHHPTWTSVQGIGDEGSTKGLWTDLVNYRVDLVLNGHAHVYERFGPMDSQGRPNSNGTREITVGTGGAELTTFGTILPASEVRAEGEYGVLQLVLHNGSYDWSFIPVVGESFTDSGSTACH
jgi:hypothetical protein